MAVLSNGERFIAWADFMRAASDDRDPIGITKQDLRAAVDAIDGWVDANSAAFNTAIPQPARGSLSAKQKARILMLVVQRRWGVL